MLDEGIDFRHPDLAANIWTNDQEMPKNGVNNDNSGKVDDVHGWDFAFGDNLVYDGNAAQGYDNHGTHVAGTIGAAGGDGTGVVGVNWNVTMISAKFLGPQGGYLEHAVEAIDYITNLKTQRGLNIVATNNSWGGGYSQALYDASERANNAGILFIAAAGNSNWNTDLWASYPSSYTNNNVISIAAIDSAGRMASFSNVGRRSVDLGAPGVSIWSTTGENTYSNYNGTSMATPHVTGAAALYASVKPRPNTVTPRNYAAQIKNAIWSSTIYTFSLNRKVVTNGRLDENGAPLTNP